MNFKAICKPVKVIDMNKAKSLVRIFSRFGKFNERLIKSKGSGNFLAHSPFLDVFPPGHFYSPIPDINYILDRQNFIFNVNSKECLGIDLREEEQLKLLSDFAFYYKDLPFSDLLNGSSRYYYQNSYFSYSDAIILYSFLRQYKPRRVIEIDLASPQQ